MITCSKMNYFIYSLVILFYLRSFSCRESEIDGIYYSSQDVVIYENEMTKDMEEFAIGETLILSRKFNSTQGLAREISNQMNNEFGKQWMTFTGRNFTESDFGIDHQKNSLIWFAFKETHFVIMKPENIENNLNIVRMIENARTSEPVIEFRYNSIDDRLQMVIDVTKGVLSMDLPHCKNNLYSKMNSLEWCTREIADKIVEKLHQLWQSDWWHENTAVTVGVQNHCYNNPHFKSLQNYRIDNFFLGDLYFQYYHPNI